MRTNGFLGRDWLDPEFSYSKEEWETLLEVGFDLKRRFQLGLGTFRYFERQDAFYNVF